MKTMDKKWWPYLVLSGLFVLSLLLRLGSFQIDPITSAGYTPFARFNNNEVWIHNKAVFDIYDSHPVTTHKFAAYIGTGSAADFVLNKEDSSLTVYTSFPAVHFILPYLFLKSIGLPLTFTGLQFFGLAIHAVCAGLLYYLLFLLTRSRLMGVLGASVYLFSTATLHYHMNVYWAHQLLVPVFLATLIVFVRQKGRFAWWQALLLGFAMSCITWTGAVAVIGFALYGGFAFWRTKNRAYLNYLWMVGGMVLALGLVLFQVLLAAGIGFPEYLRLIAHRAQARSAGAPYTATPILFWHLCNDLLINYGGYIVIAFTLAIKKKLKPFEWAVLFVASFPLLETFILLEHDTVYGFGLLKWLIPIILVLCLAGQRYATTKRRKIIYIAAVASANALHAILFFIVYQKG